MIIATVRGFLLNFGVYHATRSALHLPFEVRRRGAFTSYRALLLSSCLAVEPGHHLHHLLCDDVRNCDCDHEGTLLERARVSGQTLTSGLQDLPDVEGDRQHNIQTFATQLGVRNISLAVSCRMARLLYDC